jgi:asparagine synthase (glutamine-hydrolysing)
MTPIRFLIFLPSCASGPSADRPGFRQVGTAAGVRGSAPAFWISAQADVLSGAGQDLLLLGRIFDVQGNRLASKPDDLAGPVAGDTVAGMVAHRFWGAWLLVTRDRAGAFVVSRDPTMHLPVYRRVTDHGILLASHVDLFEAAGASQPRIAFAPLADHLRFPRLRQAATCLAGIDELPPGVCVSAVPGLSSHEYWNPWGYAGRPVVSDRRELTAQLRKLAVHCIGAWAGEARRVAVAASGGVDSSFVCAALAAADTPFDCVTVATADRSGDESAYVGQIAERMGVRMVKQVYDPSTIDWGRSPSAGLPRPVRNVFMQAFDSALREGAARLGADVIFDGNGGDNLFCYLHSSAPIFDRLRSGGSPRAVLETFLAMCRVTEADAGTMLGAMVRRALGRVTPASPPDDRLLSRDVIAMSCPIALSQWLGNTGRWHGKAAHIDLIRRTQNFTRDCTASELPMQFSPLVSQPLVEFCLAVPSWQWCAGGINRSLARDAFCEDLPVAIAKRTAKAGPDSFIWKLLEANRRQVRELLVGGVLAQNGLLDLDMLEKAIIVDQRTDHQLIYRLFELIDAEIWARSWHG